MPRGRPGQSKYIKKIVETISLETFADYLQTVNDLSVNDVVRIGRIFYTTLMLKSYLTITFWTGLRKTEIIGSRDHKYKVLDRDEEGNCIRGQYLTKISKAIPGILKEDISQDKEFLYVKALARKRGKRDSPLILPLRLKHVDLIVDQWEHTQPETRVWAITEFHSWVFTKKIDPDLYPHYFRLNRISSLLDNPKVGIREVCAWSGLQPITIDHYLGRSKRIIRQVGEKLLD